MRWKKKGFGLLFLILAGLALTGCGNRQQTAAQPENEENVTEEAEPEEIGGTLVVYTNRPDMVETKFAEYKAIFEQDNPGTEIVFKAYSNYDQDVSEKLEQGEYGDVLLIPKNLEPEKFSTYFEPFGTVEELSETYNEQYLHAAEQDGIVYGLTQYAMPQGIAYNKKVFEKAGMIELPRTPEEFLKGLEAIAALEPKVVPIFIGQRRTKSLEWWQKQALGQQQALGVMSGNADISSTQTVMEDKPFAKGEPAYNVCKLLYDIVKQGLSEEGKRSLNWKQVREMLNNGEIGCVPVEWSELSAMQEAGPNPDDIGYMPFPYTFDVQYAATELEYCYAINKNSEKKATAQAWIDYMLNSSGYAKSEGAISIRIKDSLPDFLVQFKEAVPIVYQSLFEMDIEEYRRLIESAGQEDTTFKEEMQDFNNRWKKTLQGEDSMNK